MGLPPPMQILVIGCLILFCGGLGIGAGKIGITLNRGTEQKTEQTVEVNLAKPESQGKCQINPKDCPAHEEEQRRSLENRQMIEKLFNRTDEMRECLGEIKGDIGEVKGMVTVLVRQNGGRSK